MAAQTLPVLSSPNFHSVLDGALAQLNALVSLAMRKAVRRG